MKKIWIDGDGYVEIRTEEEMIKELERVNRIVDKDLDGLQAYARGRKDGLKWAMGLIR